MRVRNMLRLAAAGVAVTAISALLAPQANAQIRLALQSGSPTGGPSTFTFTYDVFLQNGFSISTGNLTTAQGTFPAGFTLYDFFGLTGTPVFNAVASGASFTLTTPFTGTQQPVVAVDNAAARNIDLVYNGSTISNTTSSDILLGTLSADSTSGVVITNANPYVVLAQSTGGSVARNETAVNGPGITPVVVPEGGSLALLAAPMLGMVGVVARRRRSAAK